LGIKRQASLNPYPVPNSLQREIVRTGRMASSAFMVWQGEGTERKGHFVINFVRQSRHWPKGSIKTENLSGFALNLLKGECLMSWYVKSGYLHFYLHPRMHDCFLFRYGGRVYRCIALPFGQGRSVLWFAKLMRPVVNYLRRKMGY
jgi:hypothetical protein